MMKPALLNPLTGTPVKKRLKRHGFALVSTITVMMLLLMIGLGVISLSTISSKGATQDKYAAEAQANARLALSIAIGQLQKYAGPDQRVTATSSILDSDPQTETIDGVEHKHWVGVWKTNGLKDSTGDTPFIHPTQDGPLIDDRADNYAKADQVMEWLVSGKQVSPLSPLKNPVILYNAASDKNDAGDASIQERNVYGEKVLLSNKTGSYAYWVSDENSKANISLADDESSDQPDTTNYETLLQLTSPNRFGLGNVFTDYASLDNREIAKLLTQNQTSLAGLGSSPVDPDLKKAVKLLRHDITTQSASVLSDPIYGGLKKNLTAYLESGGSVPGSGSMQGITDSSPILYDMPQRDLIGPKFGAIRDWYKLKDQLSGQRGSHAIDMTFANYDSTYKTVDLNKFTEQPIQPTLMEAVYQTNYSYDPVSRYIYELIYPRVVLWNPYNVRLKTPDLYVAFEFKGNDYYDLEYQYKDGSGKTQTDKIRTTINYNFGYGGNDRIIFTIPGTTFEPGECLQFTTDPNGASLFGKAKPFARSNSGIGANRLSASTDPTELYCFYRFVKNSNGNGSNKQIRNNFIRNTMRMNYGGGILWHGDQPTQSVYLFASKGGSGNPKFTDLGKDTFPAIQRYYIDNYSRGNNGRWLPGYRPPRVVEPISSHLSQNIIPETIIGYGMRWKHFYESYSNRVYGKALREPWYYAPLVHNNVRARHIHRWDSDNMFGQVYTGANTGSTAESTAYGSGRAHLYSWGPISQTRQFPAWTDSEVTPHYHSGKYRTSPFFNNTFANSEQVFPLFELPDREISPQSLGQLQHVQFTPHVWHPSYVIGTGICSPYVQPQTTSLTYSDQKQSWVDKLNRLYEKNNDAVHLLSEAGDNPMIFDIAYETNYFMWDKYFLSSIPNSGSAAAWDNDKWDVETPLPNSRMILNSFDPASNSRTALTDYHKAANSLMIQGGFNVNSTSKLAWEALLRSFNGVKLPTRDGGNFSANPFSSLLISEKGAGNAASANEDLLWSGYRDLTDEEISLLAEQIVVQVKKRAPFIGVADFVNRRLDTPDGQDDEVEFFGTLQAAINLAGINDRLDSTSPSDFNLPNADEAKNDYRYGAEYWGGPTRTPHAQTYGSFEFKSNDQSEPVRLSKAEGAPGYLTQNDILQQIGSVLTARSDTFTIRAYGESLSTDGKVMAKAWCEATVQRIPEPINPDTTQAGLNPIAGDSKDPGRKFIITSFRWLQRNELEPAE